MKCSVAILLLSFVVFASAIGIGRKQRVHATGKLVCDGKAMGKVTVKLYERQGVNQPVTDDDRGLDTDDHMATTKTDSDGHFDISGSSHEFTDIDPKLNIYHDCNDELTPCQRKISVMIPDKYINKGTFDAGTIELSGKFKGEERDCIH